MGIRFATLKDIPVIISIARKTWPVSYKNIISDKQINYMLDLFYSPVSLLNQIEILEHKFLLLQDEEGIPIGFASFSFIPLNRGARLHKLYVLPEHHKKGHGLKLITTLINLVKKEKFSFIELNVNKNNPAYDFYLKNGFAPIREEVIDIGCGYVMDDFILMKIIE